MLLRCKEKDWMPDCSRLGVEGMINSFKSNYKEILRIFIALFVTVFKVGEISIFRTDSIVSLEKTIGGRRMRGREVRMLNRKEVVEFRAEKGLSSG